MTFLSPTNGKVLPIKNSLDSAFSQKLLGDGVVIIPEGDKGTIYSPISGKIKNLNSNLHAITIENEETGIEVFIHIGIDTVSLRGKGFSLHNNIAIGNSVQSQDPLINVDYNYIRASQLSDHIMIVVTNPSDIKIKNENFGNINSGEDLFSIS